MYKKIVVPLALDHGVAPKVLEVASKLISDDGTIIALHAVEPIPRPVRSYVSKPQLLEAEQFAMEQLTKRTGDAPNTLPVVIHGQAGWAITEYATKHKADCIVLSSHKPGLANFFLGSTAARVVRHANCSVHILR